MKLGPGLNAPHRQKILLNISAKRNLHETNQEQYTMETSSWQTDSA